MTVSVVDKKIDNLEDLRAFLAGFPEGTTCNVLASDLEAGNFEEAVISNQLYDFHVTYTGPVAEGYVSPFETQPVETDLYTLNISGVQDGTEFEDTVEIGPAPSLADAIMWERTALEQSGCTSIVIAEA